MGFLKKITRPISRVLDKIVPNEIKPALPFLAAAAPFMAPGIMGTSMLQRALVSGGLNLGSQLAQEGSDGDFSALSLAMASGIGALSAPGSQIRTMHPTEGVITSGQPSAAQFFETKGASMQPGFAKSGLGALEKSSNYLTGVGETLRTNPFSMEGLKAGLVPIGQGTTDLAIAEARRAQKDYDREMAEAEAEQGASDAQRAAAIRQSMEAYGFTDEEIEDAIYAAGYKTGGRVGLKGGGADFGGIPAAIQNIKEDEEETITIMTDNGPMEIQKSVYESMPGMFMDTTTSAYGDAGRGRPVPQFANGGRIGFKDGSDGSSTGNFGADRYASELVEAYKGILDKGDMFYTDVEKELIEKGEYPSQDQMKEFQDRYENLEKEYEKEENKFDNTDLQDSLFDEDAIKYYNKKIKDLEDREERLMDKEEKINEVMYTDLDVSGILKTPEFQEWYTLWKAKDPKADDLPGAEYFENMMFDTKRLRPDVMKTKYDVEMKDGGLMNLGGKEMDLRKGGFVPIGKKERADDVPARLSKNEFVMTADAVRAAGGGSVNKGAKRMYDLMNNLEARV
jgi:hypothetical protein